MCVSVFFCSNLRCSFSSVFTSTKVLNAEAGFETFRTHSARFVVHLWTLCTDGLQKDRERTADSYLSKISTCSTTFLSIPPKTTPKFVSFHLCSPLRRTCSDVCAWWNWSSRCSLYMSASPSPFSWNSSGKKRIVCKGLQPAQFQHRRSKRNVWQLVLLHPVFVWLSVYLFSLLLTKIGGIHPLRHTKISTQIVVIDTTYVGWGVK